MPGSGAVSFVNGVLILTCEPIGTEEVTGYATGDDVVMLEFREDLITDKVGADGEMAISIGADKSATLTIKLLQTSPTNKFLSKVAAVQGNVPTFAPISALYQDANRQDVATMLSGYIQKHAPLERGREANEPEWSIVFRRADVMFGSPVTVVI